jgi:hypothetical protein
MNTPVTVSIKPEIAEKISLFHDPDQVMWKICGDCCFHQELNAFADR